MFVVVAVVDSDDSVDESDDDDDDEDDDEIVVAIDGRWTDPRTNADVVGVATIIVTPSRNNVEKDNEYIIWLFCLGILFGLVWLVDVSIVRTNDALNDRVGTNKINGWKVVYVL